MANKHILVVDDDPAILAALELVLLDAGYDVRTSTKNGEIVDAAIEERPPDLIILDILLSGHDGRTICKKLKSQKETRQIPIMLISAHPSGDEMSHEAGADAFLAKPFEIDTLLDQVSNLL